jgi:hypothetical protein
MNTFARQMRFKVAHFSQAQIPKEGFKLGGQQSADLVVYYVHGLKAIAD